MDEEGVIDFAVVGGGAAGLAAGINGPIEGLVTTVFESEHQLGGQASEATKILNYLGFPDGITGHELMRRGGFQASDRGATLCAPTVISAIRRVDGGFILTDMTGEEFHSRAVFIATGAQYRRLEVPNIVLYQGEGDGVSLGLHHPPKSGEVYIVGGANSAGQAAIMLSRHSCRVHLVIRKGSLYAGMSTKVAAEVEALADAGKVEVLLETEVIGVGGHDKLQSLTLIHRGVAREVKANHLVILIGAVPRTEWLNGLVGLDDHKYILVGTDVPSGIREQFPDWVPMPAEAAPNVFAGGDVCHLSAHRVAAAVAAGTMAVGQVWRRLHPQ